MKNVLMKKATFTPFSHGKELMPFTIDLLKCKGLEFKYENGLTFMSAPNFRDDWVMIKESKEEIDKFYSMPAKNFKIRGTSEIVVEGNDDYKNK